MIDPEYIRIEGYGSKPKGATTRYPQDDPDGIINQYDRSGNYIATGAVSITEVEVLDVVSEGEIEGLVTGDFVYSGTLGNIGWSSATPIPYQVAPGTNARWMKSVYWNQVPLVDSANKFNFSVIDVAWTPGTPNGEVISTTSQLTASRAIGERLRAAYLDPAGNVLVNQSDDYIKTYRILNKDCIGTKINVRFGPLYERNESQEEYGDTEQTTVEYTIEYHGLFSNGRIDNWSVPYKEIVEGKINFGYIKSSEVRFSDKTSFISDPYFLGWEIRIIRLTPESLSPSLVNQTYVDSLTEIYNNKFSYPNTAVVRNKFNAEYFSQVPERSFDVKLLKVRIPTNYDPILKTYTGDWDGTFTTTRYWTDNPAWCYYDLVTNQRYGLGKYITESQIDKWTLYQIAQYCDELVADGFGGLEPRFTCNLILNTREEAFKVLNDLVSVFRGIIYYFAGSTSVAQDRKIELSDITTHFTNANVENGNFIYNTAPRRGRNTIAKVRYNDKTNFYAPAVEYVENEEGIKKLGRREYEFTAFGTTSRGQAIRAGRHALYTQLYQTETINFVAGPEARLLRPGQIFRTTDNFRNINRLGGRVLSGVSGSLILDDNLSGYFSGVGDGTYSLTLSIPRYNYEPSLVTGLSSADIPNIYPSYVQTRQFSGQNIGFSTGLQKTQINLSSGFDLSTGVLNSYATWTIALNSGVDANENASEYWTTINLVENADSKGLKYQVFGLKYDINKYGYVESGLKFETQIQNLQESGIGPSNLILSGYAVNDGQYNVNYSFLSNLTTAQAATNNYTHVLLQKQTNDFLASDVSLGNYQQYIVASLPATQTTGQISLFENGQYYYRVYTLTQNGNLLSEYGNANLGVSNLNNLSNYIIASLRLAGDRTVNPYADKEYSTYSGTSPEFHWQVGNLSNTVQSGLNFRITVRRPSNTNVPDPLYYYQITGYKTPKTYTYTFDIQTNRELDNGPLRAYDLVVETHDYLGNSSAGSNFGTNVNSEGLGDSDYSTAEGYDIIYVNNPKITGVWLTQDGQSQASSLVSGAFYTTQGINADGSIFIKLNTGHETLPDLAGAYLYYDTAPFTTGQAFAGTVPYVEVALNPLDFYPGVITIPVNLSDSVTGQYISYSLYDVFDFEGDADRTEHYISNVVQIRRSTPTISTDAAANYVTKFAGAGSLANSQIYDNGSQIGIGTATPETYLQVTGTSTFGDVYSKNLVTGYRFSGVQLWLNGNFDTTAGLGLYSVPTGAAGFLDIWVSGVRYKAALFPMS